MFDWKKNLHFVYIQEHIGMTNVKFYYKNLRVDENIKIDLNDRM